jgi:hypothetical protein
MCLAIEYSLSHCNRLQFHPFIFIVDTYQHYRTLYICRAGGLLLKFSIYFVCATAFGRLCYRYSSAKYKEIPRTITGLGADNNNVWNGLNTNPPIATRPAACAHPNVVREEQAG